MPTGRTEGGPPSKLDMMGWLGRGERGPQEKGGRCQM